MEKSSDILRDKAVNIIYFLMDIDGSLTDGTVYYSPEGETLKRFSLRDGTGFHLLRCAGIEAGFMTGENSLIVQRRAEKLKLKHCLLGVSNKFEKLLQFCSENHCEPAEVAYLGDDLNDYCLLGKVGLFFCPADASQYVKDKADIICERKGGDGAFRYAVETLLTLQGRDIIEVFNS